MCGILGWVSIENFSVRDLVSSLKRLEYRGYDSFGFATKDGTIQKFVGTIDSSINSVGSFKTAMKKCLARKKLMTYCQVY